MDVPNCYIVGAAKSGTTSLSYYLDQHPKVYFRKDLEPDFFSKHYAKGFEFYSKYFIKGKTKEVIGEGSTSYFHNPDVAERIKSHCENNIKIIVALRNPIDRAYSDFLMGVNNGVEERSFSNALQVNVHEIQQFTKQKIEYSEFSWSAEYLQVGHYFEHLSRFIRMFGTENVYVVDFDRLHQKPFELTNDILLFLGLDKLENIDTEIINRFNPTLRKIKKFIGNSNFVLMKRLFSTNFRNTIKKLIPQKEIVKPSMSSEERLFLLDYYKEDINQLNEIVNFDTSKWLI